MYIDDDHMYHGAALIQIAEHPQFTAINALRIGREPLSGAYRVNDGIALYVKYASRPAKRYSEYQFTFHTDHLRELAQIRRGSARTFIALVCVRDRQICCISYAQLRAMVDARIEAAGDDEEQHVLLVTAPKGKSLRCYVNAPGKRNTMLGSALIVPRNAFPDCVF